MLRLALLAALLATVAPRAHAQREASVWYFGRGAGIDFNGATPVALGDGAIDQEEGCASIADGSTGALLFYTDGMTVWNRDHRPMPNGTGLLGHSSATQSALIVPAPCDPTRYYVFTVDASPLQDPPNEGVHYSIVDMTLDGGRGDVTVRNVPLYAPATEKLTAVRHANGVDVWVVMHEWSSNAFRTYEVTAAGVSASPRMSYTGSAHEGLAEYGIGYLKASPDGRHMVSVVATSFVELFDFNPATGLLTYEARLSDNGHYGASFSPDSRLLYLVERRFRQPDDSLFQYDLTAGGEAAIVATRTPIAAGDFFALQNAPDGRIYIANNSALLRANLGWLPTIDRPNERGIACGFNPQGFRLSANGVDLMSTAGLPNHIESFREGLSRPCGPPEALIGMDDPICAGECVAFRDSSRGLPTSWQWTFEGGRPSTASVRNPGPICFDSAGVYTIRLVATNEKGTSETTRQLRVVSAGAIDAGAGYVTAAPGDTALIPVLIGAPQGSVPVDAVGVSLVYDRSTMRPVGVETAGGLVDGWSITLEDDTARSTVTVRAVAPAGRTLSGAGRILSVRFATWLAGPDTVPLPLWLEIPGTLCTTVPGRAGRLTLELCGLSARLIDIDTVALALRPVRPNPVAGEAAVIAFATPREGHVRLSIVDARGVEIARPVDAMLPAGDHEVVWDAGDVAAGVYGCQLQADGRVLQSRIVLVR